MRFLMVFLSILLPCVFFASWSWFGRRALVEQHKKVVRDRRALADSEINSVKINWLRANEQLFENPTVVKLFQEFIASTGDEVRAKKKLFDDIASLTGTQVGRGCLSLVTAFAVFPVFFPFAMLLKTNAADLAAYMYSNIQCRKCRKNK